MELSEITDKTLKIIEIDNVDQLSKKMMDCVMKDDTDIYSQFKELVGDLSVDWIQKIYQYWLADRKIKKQDYTPKSLAKLVGKLALAKSKDDVVVDMCAGSGALTIQTWNQNKNQKFNVWKIRYATIKVNCVLGI